LISSLIFFSFILLPPPISTLFPYTTLFRSSSVRHACAKRYSILRGIACLVSRNDAVGNGDIRASGNHAATRNGSSRIQTLCCVAGNGAVFEGRSSSRVGYATAVIESGILRDLAVVLNRKCASVEDTTAGESLVSRDRTVVQGKRARIEYTTTIQIIPPGDSYVFED